MQSLDEFSVPSEVLGVAPEIVDKALASASAKLAKEIEKVVRLSMEVRSRIEQRVDIFTLRRAEKPSNLCYVAVDSGYTAPAIELTGGYLAIIKVVTVVYGSACSKTTAEAEVHVGVWFNEDITSLAAKILERRKAIELLEAKKKGEAYFDVLVVDGELAPRGFRDMRPPAFSKFIELSNSVIKLADASDTPVVGVLKRSYARDIVNILGFHELKLSDRAVLSLVLKPGEYLVAGDYAKLREELEKLREKPGVDSKWLKARLAWYDGLLENIVGWSLKLAFYRAEKTLFPTATKVEYTVAKSLREDELLSSLMAISRGTGIPAPVDQADAFSKVTRELRQTVYQKLIAEVSKRVKVEPTTRYILLSLMNPEKYSSLLG